MKNLNGKRKIKEEERKKGRERKRKLNNKTGVKPYKNHNPEI